MSAARANPPEEVVTNKTSSAATMECAASGDRIRIDTGQSRVIDTAIWTKPPASVGSNAPIDPNEVAKTGVPFERAGQAQDIANGVLFLASRRVQLHDRRGAGNRRGHDWRRETSMELNSG
jgi:NAD(P)-dependent dehydrogenase (short-subunit alcohol dehydrogenase family)